jgi:hypothetical protein
MYFLDFDNKIEYYNNSPYDLEYLKIIHFKKKIHLYSSLSWIT